MTARSPSSARCAAALLLAVIGRPAAASPDEGSPLWTIGAARDVVGAGVVQAHEIAFDRDALAGLRIDDRVRLALVGGDAVTGVIERRDAQSDARFTVSGRVLETIGPGSFLIAIRGNGCAGSISMGDAGTFRIRGAADGALLIEQLDESGLPWCEVGPGDAAPDLPPDEPPAAPAGGATGSCDDGSIIDLLVVYTREARDAAGGGENIDAEIDLLVAAMNGAFESSEVAPRIRLVYARELSTPEDELTLNLLGATCVDVGGMFHAGSECPAACLPADDCADAPAVGEASIPFSTLAATTDGPNLPPGCGEGPDSALLRKDVWIVYLASCDGTATVSVCESDFDTKLAVYETGGCPGALIDCNDDACGEDGTRSRVAFPVEANGSYLVRVGSVDSRGEGTLVLECSGLP